MNKLAVLEGLLFVVGDEGITLEQISKILEINETETRKLLKELQNEYEKEDRGIRISFLADSFKLTTKKEHLEFYQKLITTNPNTTLSQAALETLAVIAYNQPITRVKIDELRGIASSFLIRKLLAKDLIKVCGKSDLPGHPNLYKTTKEFLDYFGLASINDLPDISIKDSTDDQVELYKSKYTENI
ncbi:MAG: SMC-Scp complex subunit ScpB [Firmicutes bacterium]|nr:SMC-Scp complex subunit ScpB [Bacillota bacterium]